MSRSKTIASTMRPTSIYQFFWGSFCDWYLEIVKLRLDFSETADKAQTKAALTTLVSVFEARCGCSRPSCRSSPKNSGTRSTTGKPPAKSIALTRYPTAESEAGVDPHRSSNEHAAKPHRRSACLRKEIGVEEKASVPIELRVDPGQVCPAIDRQRNERSSDLARVSEVRFVDQIAAGLSKHSTPDIRRRRHLRTQDRRRRRARALDKDIAKQRKDHRSAERQLNNRASSKAPPHIVEGLKKQQDEARIARQVAPRSRRLSG